MAVVQISRVQIRRGKKNQGTGMPQLASGELAWAIDTQELFIGNGSIGEGAPYVGNSKILTEHDNLLELLKQYQYRQDDSNFITGIDLDTLAPSSAFPVKRQLQSRLDEGTVNAKSFGIIPVPYPVGSAETVETQTARLNAALAQLYQTDDFSKVCLEFDPGTYQFDNSVTVPNGAHIIGAGKGITVFEFSSSGNFIEVTDASVRLKGFTVRLLENSATGMMLTDATASTFDCIRFEKNTGSSIGQLEDDTCGVNVIQSLSSNSSTTQNIFANVEFHGLTYAVTSNSNSRFNTFNCCVYRNLFKGVYMGVAPFGSARFNTFENCVFDTITDQAIDIAQGYGNKSRGNKYINVGNDAGGVESVHPVVSFLSPGNSSIQDYFERSHLLSLPSSFDLDYIPEVEGPVHREDAFTVETSLPVSLTPQAAFRLPISAYGYLEVNYVFNSSTFGQVKTGTLHITANSATNELQLVDDYEYTGPTGSDESIKFSAEIKTPQDFGGLGTTKFVVVNYTNENTPGDTNSLVYSVKTQI